MSDCPHPRSAWFRPGSHHPSRVSKGGEERDPPPSLFVSAPTRRCHRAARQIGFGRRPRSGCKSNTRQQQRHVGRTFSHQQTGTRAKLATTPESIVVAHPPRPQHPTTVGRTFALPSNRAVDVAASNPSRASIPIRAETDSPPSCRRDRNRDHSLSSRPEVHQLPRSDHPRGAGASDKDQNFHTSHPKAPLGTTERNPLAWPKPHSKVSRR